MRRRDSRRLGVEGLGSIAGVGTPARAVHALLVALLLAGPALAGCAGGADFWRPAQSASPSEPAGRASTPTRQLVWRDDFDGPVGASPDPTTWATDVGGDGWGNDELQRYTAEPANAALDGDGHLVITAERTGSGECWYGTCRFTSARLTTQGRVSAASGLVEARLRVPEGAGLWPAFWMMGENLPQVGWPGAGELDVMEIVGDAPGEAWSSVHGPGLVRAGLTAAYRLPGGGSFADGFHTFAIERTPGVVAFLVDGQEYHRVRRQDVVAAASADAWVFEEPFHLILNMAVGGDWPKEPAPHTRLPHNRFPARMVIDHVAIYR